jgi:hypothetical protein
MCSAFVTRTLAAATLAASLCASLGGCSEYYFDRRDTVSLHSGEAMAANQVTQTIDPWSPASGNRNIAYNGERMQGAAERYRTHKVIMPVSPLTSSVDQLQPPPALTTEQVGNPAQNASAPNAGASNNNSSTK